MVDNTSKSVVMGVGGADSALRQEESAPAAPSSEPQAEGAASTYAGVSKTIPATEVPRTTEDLLKGVGGDNDSLVTQLASKHAFDNAVTKLKNLTSKQLTILKTEHVKSMDELPSGWFKGLRRWVSSLGEPGDLAKAVGNHRLIAAYIHLTLITAENKARALDPRNIPKGFTASDKNGKRIEGERLPEKAPLHRAAVPFTPPAPRSEKAVLQDIYSELRRPIYNRSPRDVGRLQKLQAELGGFSAQDSRTEQLNKSISKRIRTLNEFASGVKK
ncbi:MAG: hypothetical protein JKY15_06205 [Deltaproteobacteria bacterium]|nr:hypothetical protein [Deltaproteobacteria bacterium]